MVGMLDLSNRVIFFRVLIIIAHFILFNVNIYFIQFSSISYIMYFMYVLCLEIDLFLSTNIPIFIFYGFVKAPRAIWIGASTS